MKKLLLLPLLLLISLFAMSGNASASCLAQEMDGTWVNDDPNTRSITKVEINFPCNDVVLNGRRIILPDTIRVYGSCHPTDCNWGTANLHSKFWDERESQYTYARADYDFSFKASKLYIFLTDDGKLVVSDQNRFKDGRDDYSNVAQFTKQ